MGNTWIPFDFILTSTKVPMNTEVVTKDIVNADHEIRSENLIYP